MKNDRLFDIEMAKKFRKEETQMIFEEEIKEAIRNSNVLEEAFIIEEIKPYLDTKDEKIVITETLRVRLAEIKDYKERVKKAIEKIIHSEDHNPDEGKEYYAKALEDLKEELGL